TILLRYRQLLQILRLPTSRKSYQTPRARPEQTQIHKTRTSKPSPIPSSTTRTTIHHNRKRQRSKRRTHNPANLGSHTIRLQQLTQITKKCSWDTSTTHNQKHTQTEKLPFSETNTNAPILKSTTSTMHQTPHNNYQQSRQNNKTSSPN